MRNSALALLLLLAAAMTTCRSEEQAIEKFSVRVLSPQTVSGRWEKAAESGLGRIAAELDADVARVRINDPEDVGLGLSKQGQSGIDLVFCVGAWFPDSIFAQAAAFPKTVFIQLPGDIEGANVGGIQFLPEEAGFLAGAVAGAVATNRRVGLLQGEGRPWLEQLEKGFLAGFRSRQRRVVVQTAEGEEGVVALSDAGIEIALYACDHAQPGVVSAARDAGLLLVGTDPELMAVASDSVVAAVDVDVAEAMLRVARDVRDGFFAGRVYAFDLGSGVLDVVVSEDLEADVMQTARTALDEARSEITAGLVEFDELGL